MKHFYERQIRKVDMSKRQKIREKPHSSLLEMWMEKNQWDWEAMKRDARHPVGARGLIMIGVILMVIINYLFF